LTDEWKAMKIKTFSQISFQYYLRTNNTSLQRLSQISGKQISRLQSKAATVLTSSPQCHHGNAIAEKHEGCLDPNCYGKQSR